MLILDYIPYQDAIEETYYQVELAANIKMREETGKGPYTFDPVRVRPWLDNNYHQAKLAWFLSEYGATILARENKITFEDDRKATLFVLKIT